MTLKHRNPKSCDDVPAGRFRRKRKRTSAAASDDPTPEDNLLYLLCELERAVELPTVTWSAQLADGVQRRLERLVHAVRQVAARER